MVTLAFDLKVAFVFPGSIISPALWYYRHELEEPRRHVWAPIQPSSILPRYLFLWLHGLINAACAPWCRIIHQTKWPGSALRQPPRLPSLPLPFACCYQERRRIFHLLSVGNILWQSNNLFPVPFECLTMCLLKEATKVQKPQGLASWSFWSRRPPSTSANSLRAAGCSSLSEWPVSGDERILLTATSNVNCIISQRRHARMCVKVSAMRCALFHRRRIKQVSSWTSAISAQPCGTRAHAHTHSHARMGWPFQFEIVRFFSAGLAAHVLLSPSDHSSKARKSAVVPGAGRPDWT